MKAEEVKESITKCSNCNGEGGFVQSECGEGCCLSGEMCEQCLGTGLDREGVSQYINWLEERVKEQAADIVELNAAPDNEHHQTGYKAALSEVVAESSQSECGKPDEYYCVYAKGVKE